MSFLLYFLIWLRTHVNQPFFHFYRPQTKFATVMFLQASVILLTGGGACVVAHGGACVVAHRGGTHGCSWGGHAWLLTGGACVVAHGGCAWLLMGGTCVVAQGGCVFFFLNEVRSMSGRYASYWNAFLLNNWINLN